MENGKFIKLENTEEAEGKRKERLAKILKKVKTRANELKAAGYNFDLKVDEGRYEIVIVYKDEEIRKKTLENHIMIMDPFVIQLEDEQLKVPLEDIVEAAIKHPGKSYSESRKEEKKKEE